LLNGVDLPQVSGCALTQRNRSGLSRARKVRVASMFIATENNLFGLSDVPVMF
jgi:hypothetical protein